jgi:hypothetical protein
VSIRPSSSLCRNKKMMMMIIIIEIDVMQQVFPFSFRLLQSIIVIDKRRLYGVIVYRRKSNVRWRYVRVHQFMFVICLSSIDEFIIEWRQLAKNIFRQQSKYIHMKNICLVGPVVDNDDDHRLLDVNIMLLVLIEKNFRRRWNLYSWCSQ